MARSEKGKEKSVIEGKIFAVLSYLSILCIIPLLFQKDNEFVLSHGKQGLVIFVCQVGVFILSILLPGILKPGMFVLWVMSFIGIITVLQGRYVAFPVIANLADKITL